MELFTVSVKDGGIIGFEINSELSELISLEELNTLEEPIKQNIYPIAKAISQIISKNYEKKGGIINE